jgi:hypothetical protein
VLFSGFPYPYSMKKSVLLLFLAVSPFIARADNTAQVDWEYQDISPQSIFASDGVTPLAGSAGSFALQLGYYSASTASSPFAGTWIPLVGPGSANPSINPSASMGSGVTAVSGTDDRFNLLATLDQQTTNSLPSSGSNILAMRYYNASSIASATFYGAVANAAWTYSSLAFASTPPSPVYFNINDSGAVFQGGASEPETNISLNSVPEPSTYAYLAGSLGICAMFTRRRRK